MLYMPEYRHKWCEGLKSSVCRVHNGHWLGIPAGSHDHCMVALHLEKYVQRLSRAKPATAPVRPLSRPSLQGIEEELLHGHRIKLQSGAQAAGSPDHLHGYTRTKELHKQCLRAYAPPWEFKGL